VSSNTEQQKILKAAIAEMRNMRSRITCLEQAKIEPIAIIGMDCRFPGGANNPDAYWKMLRNGGEGIVEVPRSRWDIEQYYDSDPNAPGKMYSRSGGFIEDVDLFDPQFFGISPREAESIDPQQRLLLEVSYTALENSGECLKKLRGSKTGVFIGQCFNDYSRRSINSGDLKRIDALNCLGNTSSISAGRIAYALGLQGVTLQLDTTCSSSLVAIHLACQSLRNQESNLAIAGGVNLMLSPEVTIGACRLQALSPDGRCKTFDAKADGYVRGEGCGIVVLKRLKDALADNNHILAIIRGSAVNHDGKSNGLTAPNGKAQEAVISEALVNARVQPEEIGYVEAHGTGTSLGDPIEVLALSKVFNGNRESKLKIGSVKTNIGHLESAAGVASLIKVILSLQHKALPPHLNYDQPNPYIPWDKLPIEVCDRFTEWNNETRIAGVSSFGISGTNAHIIVEQAPQSLLKLQISDRERPLQILALSAKTSTALTKLAHNYLAYLTTYPDLAIEDICFSANTGREQFTHRLTILADSTQQLQQNLLALSLQSQSPNIFQQPNPNPLNSQPKIAFMFTGQSSQYVGMAQQLYQTQPSFRQIIEQCSQILQPYLEQPLLSVLYPNDEKTSLIHQTQYAQPALFTIEYALAQLWMSWGIQPDVVMGHSLGEYVAATIAGVFSLEDGLKLVAHRAKLMQQLPAQGMMVAVLADEATVTKIIESYPETQVSIAAINTPQNVVLSGKTETIESIVKAVEAQGLEVRPLNVSHAFHSSLMQPMLVEFEQVARQINYSPPKRKIISNVTGELIESEIATAKYWCSHIRQAVQFKAGVKTIEGLGCDVLLEIGAKPILLGMARACLGETENLWLPSLRPQQSDWQQMLESLSGLYLQGADIDWLAFERGYPHRRIPLPTYPFERQRYWFEPDGQKQSKSNTLNAVESTFITDLLNRGDVAQLNQLLTTSEESSSIQLTPQKAIEKLVQKHQQELKAASTQNLLYEIKWRLKPFKIEPILSDNKPKNWLIFADFIGYGDSLAQLLEAKGHQCTLVYEGETYQQISSNTWQLQANNQEDLKLLLREITKEPAISLEGIIHLWSLNLQPTSELNLDSLPNSQTTSCGSVLALLQTLIQENLEIVPRLWLVTKGAVTVTVTVEQSSLSIAQASLYGLGKTIALEHRDLWGGMIDLDPAQQNLSEESNAIFQQVNATDAENSVAFRQQKRYVSRLVQRCD
jgi:malonyl CoA-acyl carrier protein transacylase